MKFPESFRPEKSLDDKTIQMVEEANVFKKVTENSPVNADLELILQYKDEHFKYFKDDIFHNLLHDLAFKSNYTIGRTATYWQKPTNPSYLHWIREDDYDSKIVNILTRRRRVGNIKRYSFAKVPKSMIKNDYFYKKFEKYA